MSNGKTTQMGDGHNIKNLQKAIARDDIFTALGTANMLEHKVDLITCWIDGNITAYTEHIKLRTQFKEDARDLENAMENLNVIKEKLKTLKGADN